MNSDIKKTNLNLISEEVKSQKISEQRSKSVNFVLIGLLVLLTLLCGGATYYFLYLNKSLKDLEAKQSIYTKSIESLKDTETLATNLQISSEKLSMLTNLRLPYSTILKGISENLPQEVTLNSFSLKGSELSLEGSSLSYPALGKFIDESNLKIKNKIADFPFTSVSLKSATLDNTSNAVSFSLSFSLLTNSKDESKKTK